MMNKMSMGMLICAAFAVAALAYSIASWTGAVIGFVAGFVSMAKFVTKGRYLR